MLFFLALAKILLFSHSCKRLSSRIRLPPVGRIYEKTCPRIKYTDRFCSMYMSWILLDPVALHIICLPVADNADLSVRREQFLYSVLFLSG